MNSSSQEITFSAGEEILAGTIVRADPAQVPSFLFLHGAGTSDRTRALYIMEWLAEYDIGSLGFDFSGHGKSTGILSNSSLKKRVREASAAAQFLDLQKPIAVYGSSMGGHTALRLLGELPNIASLILFVPAIYDQRAYEVPFDASFSEIIRQPESWKNSELFPLLEQYTGNLLIFAGEKDKVVPQGVIELLDQHSPNAKRKEIVWIPDCDHAMQAWISSRPELKQRVLEKILEFMPV